MSFEGKLPLIIAHRGASAVAPENTLAAFRKAIEAGADGIEFDVRLAKDNVPVVFHDSTLQRMAKKKIRTSQLSSAELQTVDVGAWFDQKQVRQVNEKFSGETIPTLAQVFDLLKNFRGRIYVELKGNKRETIALVEKVQELIQKTNLLPQIILKSFTLEAVAYSREKFPEIRTAALIAPKLMPVLRKRVKVLELAEKCGAHELSIHHSLATPKLMQQAQDENLPVTIWTADEPKWVERALKLGITAIITNNPSRLLARRAEILR